MALWVLACGSTSRTPRHRSLKAVVKLTWLALPLLCSSRSAMTLAVCAALPRSLQNIASQDSVLWSLAARALAWATPRAFRGGFCCPCSLQDDVPLVKLLSVYRYAPSKAFESNEVIPSLFAMLASLQIVPLQNLNFAVLSDTKVTTD